jgi:hypothetical protein
MKKIHRTRAVIALTAVAVVILLAIQACVPFGFRNLHQGMFGLVIKVAQKIKDKSKFEKALSRVQHDGVSYHFELVLNDKEKPIPYDYGPKVVIKTDRVFITELAQSLSKDELTPIGASLTHHLYSTDSKDITTILNEIQK